MDCITRTILANLPPSLRTYLDLVERRFPAKRIHSGRVADLAVRIGQVLGLPDADISSLSYGALLHDVGIVGIPDGILTKPCALTAEEWHIMQKHPTIGANLVSLSPDVAPIAYIPRSHHERWDGNGYPDGRRAEDIPLVARIISVADVWDALLEDRPYRLRWPEAQVRHHMREGAGTQFDPDIVQVLLERVVGGAGDGEL